MTSVAGTGSPRGLDLLQPAQPFGLRQQGHEVRARRRLHDVDVEVDERAHDDVERFDQRVAHTFTSSNDSKLL